MTPEEKAVKLAEVDSRSRSNTHRLDALEQRQAGLEDLAASVKVLATRMEHTESALKNIETDLKEIKSKPGRRLESLVNGLLAALASALVGALAVYLRMSGG